MVIPANESRKSFPQKGSHACIDGRLSRTDRRTRSTERPPANPRRPLQLQLFAEHPDIVTPVGIAVDKQGRILCIESHTHFPPDGYDGPKTDRIKRFEDTNGDGRADKVSIFYEGSTKTMGLEVHPNGTVYVATRSEIFTLRDTNNDGRADKRTRIAHLETAGDYPHNGLSGFAFDQTDHVYFGFGENLGAPLHADRLGWSEAGRWR